MQLESLQTCNIPVAARAVEFGEALRLLARLLLGIRADERACAGRDAQLLKSLFVQLANEDVAKPLQSKRELLLSG